MPPEPTTAKHWRVYVEPSNPAYGFKTHVEYPSEYMAMQAAEGLRHASTYARVWVEAVGAVEPGQIDPDDFAKLGRAFAALHSQAINGVVCDPTEESGRRNCKSCREAFADGCEVLDKYDAKWGNMYRPGAAFQPEAPDGPS